MHVHASTDAHGALNLAGAADSRLAKGLVALLVRGLQGVPVEALEGLTFRAVAEAAGLPELLTPGRLNGMEGMLRLIAKQIDHQAAAAPEAVRAADGVSQGPQGPAVDAATATSRRLVVEEARVEDAPVIQAVPAQPRLLWPAAEEEVALLLSGGVDSSVALHQLLAAGHKVRAFYLRIWLEDEQQHAALGACPWEEDWAYCQAVCDQVGVPLEAVSLQHEYQDQVVSYLIEEAAAGRTPNPDIMCNSRIKFGVFHDRIGRHFRHVASGHYAQTRAAAAGGVGESGLPLAQLLCSADTHKDQTYFLSQLKQRQLATTLFPIGGLPKPEVRALARALHLPNRDRKDSQGICFLGQVNYDSFLRQHLGERPGPIREYETGAEIGTHRGLWFHTVGQRRGLVPSLENAYRARGPWHVVGKDFDANVLYATREYHAEDKARDEFTADGLNWVAGHPPAEVRARGEMALRVKVRHGAESHEAAVTFDAQGDRAHVQLSDRATSLAPGQFAAFYDGDVCLGSGTIVQGAI